MFLYLVCAVGHTFPILLIDIRHADHEFEQAFGQLYEGPYC